MTPTGGNRDCAAVLADLMVEKLADEAGLRVPQMRKRIHHKGFSRKGAGKFKLKRGGLR